MGLDELDKALQAFEEAEDWDGATSVANEILRLEPNSVPHLQKCVEFAYRRGDKSELVPAYVDLANGLFRSGAMEESRTVYERVLELDPENEDAKEGIATAEQLVPAPTCLRRPGSETHGRICSGRGPWAHDEPSLRLRGFGRTDTWRR